MAHLMAMQMAQEMAATILSGFILMCYKDAIASFCVFKMPETEVVKPAQKREFIGLKTGKGFHSKDVSRRNTDAILLWTYQWGWTTESALKQLLKLQRRLGYEMSKRGYLEKVVSPRASRLPFAYVISSAALRSAAALYTSAFNAPLPLPYPWPRKPVPFISQGEHQEKAQLTAIGEIHRAGGRLLTTRQLMAESDANDSGSLPDFQIELPDGSKEWHEIEISPKYAERLIFQVYGREQARANGAFDKLVWWCDSISVAQNIKTVLSAESLPATMVRTDGSIARDATRRGWSPKKLLESCEFLVIGDSRDNPTPIPVKPGKIRYDHQRDYMETLEVVDGL